MDRFVDPAVPLYDLAAGDIAVVCQRCARRAVVAAVPVEDARPISWPRRFACGACGASASWEPRGGTTVWGAPVDPFFRLPLWLSARCCGGRVLWAFNDAHLTLLEGYVAAKSRERGPRPGLTLVARLPGWLKQAKHRDELLRVITRLRAKPG
ncbi:hypothetical protein Daura_19350 [Dactylosporangium aurantiacum]|uniref:TFIIB-type zinc ribbon-containing protein n=1 Tax=Dactylosporangium aurantiacum TaxID=35754 RepID=A0A9Q9IM08_9ACTN|nr:hypothetical protein [Dactylosporangium aurantiacum]MDG6110362.1 hypothetical protein [Dactylosporangium aurantiacum]UWZ58131.1 hypothetical protein Daura_19350 [Dactylosporangium aurantiacum]